jgi:hypothetical protein
VSAANRGPKSYFEGSPGVRREFARLAEDEPYSPNQTRKIAKNRLTKAVLEGRPSNVAREIELLGRLKEHDWWVRASFFMLNNSNRTAILLGSACQRSHLRGSRIRIGGSSQNAKLTN